MNGQPFIISFYGPPGSGKTTAAAIITKILAEHGFKVIRPPEGSFSGRNDDRHSHMDDVIASFDEFRPQQEVLGDVG